MQDAAVLVTGAARRIGAVVARRLHGAGARVALHYHRSRNEAESLCAELAARRPGSCIAVRADLLDVPSIERLVAEVGEAFGRLDGLVNNASSFYATPFGAIGEREWKDLMGTNLRAPLFLAQAAAGRLREARGTIVNVIDIHAERPLKDFTVYSVAKAGLAGLTRALAME
ncbi:MAG TPA: SDR family NAD(P)-dependent oxidoreductase, partial [Usitatibacter sp.]|nr:SDR family NAD(P)-dependent oxidoreductase [Usitatibacter sp.]